MRTRVERRPSDVQEPEIPFPNTERRQADRSPTDIRNDVAGLAADGRRKREAQYLLARNRTRLTGARRQLEDEPSAVTPRSENTGAEIEDVIAHVNARTQPTEIYLRIRLQGAIDGPNRTQRLLTNPRSTRTKPRFASRHRCS